MCEGQSDAAVSYSPPGAFRFSMQSLRNAAVIVFVCYLIIGQFRRGVSHGPETLSIQSAREPVRFFPRGSGVKDFYTGNTSGLAAATFSNDLTLIFLYAPWCLSSQDARREFEAVARKFRNQAAFVAVNCAYHAGACARHRRPENFPLIGAYLGRSQRLFITYRGVPTALHLEIFIRRLLRPYQMITRKEEFDEFIHTNDVAVVAHIPVVARENRALRVFWNVSTMTLRHDPRGAVGFALLGDNKLSDKVGLTRPDALYIFRGGKEAHIFPQLSRHLDTVIESAILEQARQSPLRWIFPTFHKSFALSEILQNATLIFFTPYQEEPCKLNPLINLIHRISAMYQDCDRSTNFTRLLIADRQARLKKRDPLPFLKERCRELEADFAHSLDRRFRASLSREQSCICLPEMNNDSAFTRDLCWQTTKSPFSLSSVPLAYNMPPVSCHDGCSNGITQNRVFSSCCYRTAVERLDDQRRALAELEACRNPPERLMRRGLDTNSEWPIMTEATAARLDAVHGIRCRTNRTLEFAAIDSTLYPHFLETVGVRGEIFGGQSTMIIADKKESEKFVFDRELDATSIADFIHNYTNNQLVAHRKSVSNAPGKPTTPSLKGQSSVNIGELTAQSFSIMLNSEKDDVVVLYYTPWCTFCKSVHSALYNLAAVFRNVTGLSFQRINIYDNDLPWEHKVTNVPTVQIFPTRRKRDNVATFPSSSILSLLNLLKFTLLHVSPQVWRGVVSSRCADDCWLANRRKSYRLLRVLERDVKLLRTALSSHDERCDRPKLKWRIRWSRRKIRFLHALLSADSAQLFIDHFLVSNTSLVSNVENDYFVRNFVVDLGMKQ
ncbi:putative Thioredoxin domain-containing protein 11 [Hypsibius exemplaris]|uniref:Thioredoxin domain-containing protein 11 n=1 Tax=Hypsibius exemplaris TaxID=2072580 RepID=A0A9X6NEP2_HYPEX|nr:putative Thioredoxin domain-containing protein 11 [Hypsibius exemplaris]